MPWFAIGRKAPTSYLLEKGLDPEAVWPAWRVMPMGWLSAVGIAQHFLRQLAMVPIPRGAGLPAEFELRKDRRMPTNLVGRVMKFFSSYIGNHDGGQLSPGITMMASHRVT